MKFSTSKAILHTFKKEGRIGKKKNRQRKPKAADETGLAATNLLNKIKMAPTTGNLGSSKETSTESKGIDGFVMERGGIIDNAITRIQINQNELLLQQQALSRRMNEKLFAERLNNNTQNFTGIPQQSAGLNTLLHTELQQKLLVESVIQRANVDFLLTNQLNQQIMAAQTKQRQFMQLNLLQNLNQSASSFFPGMNIRETFNESAPLSYIPTMNEQISPKDTMNSLMNLQYYSNMRRDSMTNNAFNRQDLLHLGSIPTKKVCSGDFRLSSFF